MPKNKEKEHQDRQKHLQSMAARKTMVKNKAVDSAEASARRLAAAASAGPARIIAALEDSEEDGTSPQQEEGAVATANGEVVEVESGSDAEAAGAGSVTTPAPIPSSPSFSGGPPESSASSDLQSSQNHFFTEDINSEPCRRNFAIPAPSFRTQMPPPLPKAPALAISPSQKTSEHGDMDMDNFVGLVRTGAGSIVQIVCNDVSCSPPLFVTLSLLSQPLRCK